MIGPVAGETVTMTLSEFLLARLAEDEAAARHERPLNVGTKRWLADVAAKRAIVEDASAPYMSGHVPPTRTLRHLAQPYADHPDFREEWRA